MTRLRGYVLLPVVIALTLIAAVCFQLSRDNGMNAAVAGRGNQADAARLVAEAGLARIHAQTQASYCNGYVDFPPTAFGPDSFTATVNPKSGTPVTLTATGTTAGGASASLTRTNVVARQGTPYTRTLQPGPAGKDTYVSSTGGDKNYGGDDVMMLDTNKYPLLQFDLASIPAGSLIQSAEVSLYVASGSIAAAQTYTAYPMTRDWVEGTGTGAGGQQDGATWTTYNGSAAWTTAGGDYDAAAGVATPAVLSIGRTAFDVTALVAAWVRGATPNYGLILKGTAGLTGLNFATGEEDSDTSRWPKITVTFVPPCGWAPVTTQTLAAVADARNNENQPTLNYGATTSLRLSGAAGSRERAFFGFVTSSVVPGTPVTSAKLRLYVSSVTSPQNSTLRVYRVTESWTEGTKNGSGTADGLTWNRRTTSQNWGTAGGSYASTAIATLAIGPALAPGWIEFDVKTLAQSWVDGVYSNDGVMVTIDTTEVLLLESREAAANQPQLVITY